jgi:hypothetical protein
MSVLFENEIMSDCATHACYIRAIDLHSIYLEIEASGVLSTSQYKHNMYFISELKEILHIVCTCVCIKCINTHTVIKPVETNSFHEHVISFAYINKVP